MPIWRRVLSIQEPCFFGHIIKSDRLFNMLKAIYQNLG